MRKPSPQPSTPIWIRIVALCLVVLLIGFFIYAYFNTPNPTIAQSDMVRLLYPLLAGFATYFISGEILLFIDAPISSKIRLALSASTGLAIFIFVYLYPPYWYRTPHNEPFITPSSTATPTNSPAPIAAKPSPVASTPAVTITPVVAFSATPTPVSTGQPVQITQSTPQMPPTQVSSVAKAGRVLLLIEEETVLQAMLKKMADYDLRATSGEEFGEAESRQIRALLPQVRSGNSAAISPIPFAVVVTGKITSLSKGGQAPYLVDATATLNATVIATGEVLRHEPVTRTGGGQNGEAALQRALREVAADIPEEFIRQITARAR